MALKVQAWSEQDFSKHCGQRLRYAKDYRKALVEEQWRINEEIYYNAALQAYNTAQPTIEDLISGDDDVEHDISVRDVAINYIFRDIRYMHAQMSANPPTVKIIPASVDAEDEDRAESADLACRWAKEEYDLQEISDNRSLKTLTKGIGYIRVTWDSTLGKMVQFGEEDGLGPDEFVMSGDIKVYSPSSWSIWIDPDAKVAKDVSWYFEEISMPMEEALLRWPQHEELLRRAKSKGDTSNAWRFWDKQKDTNRPHGLDHVVVYLYLEKAQAVNGMQGRYCVMLDNSDNSILEYGANPNPGGCLGLDILTDIDVEDQVYAKSIIEYLDKVQAVIQALDANALSNLAAHNTIRMYVSEDAEIDDEGVTNSSVDIIRGKPGQPPHFIQPPALMPDGWRFREQLYQGSREISMINESMLGQASRETSGFTTQIQVNQGNMGRRRLFNKYAASTKNVYKMILGEMIENWDEPRLVKVLGEERAFMSKALRGADLEGGWDIISEYGQNFSLDPNTARDQIMQLFPLFEKIPGFDYRVLIEAVRLNVMDNIVDKLALAKRKQRRIFKEMIQAFKERGSMAYIKPKPLEDHANMIAYGKVFVMTAEYENLDENLQHLIDQHIKEREETLAQELAQAQAAQQTQTPPGQPDMPQLPM